MHVIVTEIARGHFVTARDGSFQPLPNLRFPWNEVFLEYDCPTYPRPEQIWHFIFFSIVLLEKRRCQTPSHDRGGWRKFLLGPIRSYFPEG